MDNDRLCSYRKGAVPGQWVSKWRIVSLGNLQNRQAGSAIQLSFRGYVPQLSTCPSLQREYKVWIGRGKRSLRLKFVFRCLQRWYLCPWRQELSSIMLWKRCVSRWRIRVQVVADCIGRAKLIDLAIDADASFARVSASVLPMSPM